MKNWFQAAINSSEFYNDFLPSYWSDNKECERFVTFMNEGGVEGFKTYLVVTMYSVFFAAPSLKEYETQILENPDILKDFNLFQNLNPDDYTKLFDAKPINVDDGYHVYELTFSEAKTQSMINKIERVFLTCKNDLTRREVITLEYGMLTNTYTLLGIGAMGERSNYGSVSYENIYSKIRGIIKSSVTPSVKSFQNLLNTSRFYYYYLPILWNNDDVSEKFTSLDETTVKKYIITIMVAIHASFIEESIKSGGDEAIKAMIVNGTDMSLLKGFILDDDCLDLFALKRINLDIEYLIYELTPFEPERQQMLNKVEKVFLTCTKNFSQRKVIALERGGMLPVSKSYFMCEAALNGKHINYGPVLYENAYAALKKIINDNSPPAIITQ